MKKFYKGFNEDLTCRGFQYEEGEEGTTITIGWLIFSLCINIKR